MNPKENVSVEQINRTVMESLASGETKYAQDASTGFIRIQLREDSFAFKIMPPEQITPDQLDRDVDETIRVIGEIEPDSPGAKWVPLQDVPEGEYIVGGRYVIPFARVVTRKYTKDLAELYTYRMDIRKVLTDNSIKDGLAAIDARWITAVNAICKNCPAVDQPHYITGKQQWRQFTGGITRENLVEASTMLPNGNAEGKFVLRNDCMLMNDYTARQVLKFRRDEWGGDGAQENLVNGLQTAKLLGLKAIYTIKNHLIPNNTIFFFAAPEFLGHCYYLDDWTMWMKREAYFIQMFSYWFGGFGFGNVAGMARADFVPDSP